MSALGVCQGGGNEILNEILTLTQLKCFWINQANYQVPSGIKFLPTFAPRLANLMTEREQILLRMPKRAPQEEWNGRRDWQCWKFIALFFGIWRCKGAWILLANLIFAMKFGITQLIQWINFKSSSHMGGNACLSCFFCPIFLCLWTHLMFSSCTWESSEA